jgi:hypothetical protein
MDSIGFTGFVSIRIFEQKGKSKWNQLFIYLVLFCELNSPNNPVLLYFKGNLFFNIAFMG